MDDLEICPLTLTFAIADIGTWAPDPNCNMYGSMYNDLNCLQHAGAQHCVINLKPTLVVIYYYLIHVVVECPLVFTLANILFILYFEAVFMLFLNHP